VGLRLQPLEVLFSGRGGEIAFEHGGESLEL